MNHRANKLVSIVLHLLFLVLIATVFWMTLTYIRLLEGAVTLSGYVYEAAIKVKEVPKP